eukprot:4475914-Prymnesium_polylepis.1
MGLHERASGARISQPKCQGLRFGPHPERDPATGRCAVSGVVFPDAQGSVCHLGVFLGADA